MVNKKTLKPSTRDPQPISTLHASRFTLNSQLTTRNPQPISGLTPLLPANFTLLRFTHHALCFFLVPRPSPLVPFRDVIFVTVNSKMAKMAGK
jgi:hypothetical protein